MRALALATAITITAASVAACKTTTPSGPNITATPPTVASTPKTHKSTGLPAGTHRVTYRIGGTASRAMITYVTPSGEEQRNGAHVPWHKTLKVKDFGMASISAQNSGSGTITCEIDVDGKTVKRSKSSGAYAIASCDATIGF